MTQSDNPLAQYDLGAVPGALSQGSIIETPDMARVRALPARADIPPDVVEALSRMFCSDPKARLRDHQALALREFYEVGGLVAPIRVGGGKTLITLLAPTMFGSERAVLVTKASLRDEARREFAAYRAAGWDVRMPHILSYAKLGQKNAETELLRLSPDLLMFDEAHKLKNLRSASSVRRVARAIKLLRPRVAMLSGSLFGPKLMDYWHLLCWALGDHAPVPLVHAEAQRWALALDESEDFMAPTCALGALATLPGGFDAHKLSRRGVVPTMGGDCPAKIVLRKWAPDLPETLADLIGQVEQTGLRPDGELLEDTEKADTILQLSQGFWYRWDPTPPDWWLDPRREWNRYLRAVVEAHVPGFDSPFAVRTALDSPSAVQPPDHAIGLARLAAWRAVRDQYEPTVVPEWIDDSPLRAAIDRAGDGCLIWTRHTAAGVRLGELLGVPYFGAGSNPRTHAGQTIAASIQAHGTGKNLQAWSRNLVLTLPANPTTLEQLMGRTHRPGNDAPEVSFDMYTATGYQQDTLRKVRSAAIAAGASAGIDLKITKGVWHA